MNRKTNLILLVSICALCTVFSGCGNNTAQTTQTTTGSQTQTTAATTAASTTKANSTMATASAPTEASATTAAASLQYANERYGRIHLRNRQSPIMGMESFFQRKMEARSLPYPAVIMRLEIPLLPFMQTC